MHPQYDADLPAEENEAELMEAFGTIVSILSVTLFNYEYTFGIRHLGKNVWMTAFCRQCCLCNCLCAFNCFQGPLDVDPQFIQKVAQTLDFENIDANPNDPFQKAQYQLIADDPQYYQPQMNVPTEGPLLPLDFTHQREMGAYLGNNGSELVNMYL